MNQQLFGFLVDSIFLRQGVDYVNYLTVLGMSLMFEESAWHMSQEPTITMKKLDSYVSEAIYQNDNAIFNLLLEKLKAVAINKEQLTERLNYLVEIKVLQNKPGNGVNSFYIINIESESSELPPIQILPDTPKIKDFSKTKLNDNDVFRSRRK